MSGKHSGFTLVELLVVISIISILSVIGITIFNGAQKTARDAKRKADLYSLAQAVGLYYYDHGSWPISWIGCSIDSPSGKDWSDAFKTAMAPYMTNLPLDPINNGWRDGSGNVHDRLYCFAPNMWCGDHPATAGIGSCYTGIANFWTYQEGGSTDMIGDSARFKYGWPHFMKSIDPL